MVSLMHEERLLQEIDNLTTSGKIQSSVGLAQAVKSEIERLVRTTRQRIDATKFYLDLMEHLDFDFYLGIQASPPRELRSLSVSKLFVDSANNDLHVQINLLNKDSSTMREISTLVVFIVLNGFFSNLVSLEDCIAEIINITYDLNAGTPPSAIRKELNKKMPNGNLTTHLLAFRAVGQDGKPDRIGSPFNIAKKIRNQLTHDDIDRVVVSSFPISLSGLPPTPKLHFHNSFFAPNTTSADTEMITFCKDVYQKTIDFVDECYRLICADLQHTGTLPV